MKHLHLLRTFPIFTRHAFHTSPSSSFPIPPLPLSSQTHSPDASLSQSHATSPTNRAPQSTQSIHVSAGLRARHPENRHQHDAASPHSQYRPASFGTGGGNREGVGFIDQVGGAGASADFFASKGRRGMKTSAATFNDRNGSGIHTNKKVTRGGQDPSISQGLASSPSANQSPQDVQTEHVSSGIAARDSDHPLDAASRAPKHKPDNMGSGNKEQVGFVEQVGGASGRRVGSGSRYMPDDVKTSTAVQWKGKTTQDGLISQLRPIVQSALSGTAPSQWEGRRSFFTSHPSLFSATGSSRQRPDAGRSQKQKDEHLTLGKPSNGIDAEKEKEKLAASRFGNQSSHEKDKQIEREQGAAPGTDENARSPSGMFHNSGVPQGKSE